MTLTTVYFKWSASEVLGATFVRWQRKLNPRPLVANKQKTGWVRGKRRPGWWGIGTVVKSNIFNWAGARNSSRREGLPPLHVWLAPHTELYASREDAWQNKNPLPKPDMKEYLVLQKWT